MVKTAQVLLIPAARPFATEVAQRLVAEHQAELPDFGSLTLVSASPALLRPLRAALVREAGGALLGPHIVTAQQLALAALPAGSPAPMSALACRLQLAEWLTRLRSVFPDQDPTRVADALFLIFEELALNAAHLPASETEFAAQLRAAYSAPDHPEIEALSREAQIVHRLWRAYVEQIGDRAPAVAYLRGLAAALDNGQRLHFLGFDKLHRAESAMLRPAIARGQVLFWTQGRLRGRDGEASRALLASLSVVAPDSGPARDESIDACKARTALLDACFAEPGVVATERAAALSADGDSRIRLVAAANPEHEARIVDLAVREALLAGARRVAVISSDRRLARRLRALLERAGLGLEDRVGWAVSTSRAAAALSSWLECLETDFHFRPLLDLLKSGFYAGQGAAQGLDDGSANGDAEALRRPEPMLAARLESEVLYARRMREDSVPINGLSAFAKALGDHAYPAVFERLRRAAALLPIQGAAQLGSDWTRQLLESLKTLGLSGGLADDNAGAQLLAALSQLQNALQGVPLRLRWRDFRALLDRHIEEATFRPALAGGAARVALYTLEQTQGLEADALVLASATRAQLPGSAPGEVFFNQAVRRELGLPTWPQRQALVLSQLRRVLEAAPSVIATYAASSDGEAPQPSAWLEALAAFAEHAGFAPLHDHALARRALLASTQVAIEAASTAMPAVMPAPAATPDLLDFSLSASGHQALIECPYRFHARNALQLYPEQAPDAAATRSDYGQRVHAILHAFHEHHDPNLPPPYQGTLNAAALPAISEKLHELADAVFEQDLRYRPLARTWRHEFSEQAPWLAEQLIAAGDEARVEVEVEHPRVLAGWTIKGQIDRLEHTNAGRRVIDYKTGRVPKEDEVLAGEQVQLPHYALEIDGAVAIEYWNFQERKRAVIEGEPLSELAEALETRLAALRDDLAHAHVLPAHGNDKACARCDYAGICRHDAWPSRANFGPVVAP